jgi:hypothetical protein
MLERDEARRLYSNSTYKVVQLKARLEGLQEALSVMEEEVAEARASAMKGSRCPRGGVNWAFLKINCKN